MTSLEWLASPSPAADATGYTDDGSADPAGDGMLAGLVAGTVYRYAVSAYLDGENAGDRPLRGDVVGDCRGDGGGADAGVV